MNVHRPLWSALALAWFLALTGCGQKDQFETANRAQDPGTGDAQGEGAAKKAGEGGQKKGSSGSRGESSGASGGEGESSESSDPGQTGGSEGGVSGRAYFHETLLPKLEAGCMGCHAEPRMEVDVRGPLSIYSYKKMKMRLSEGDGSRANAFIDKVRGIRDHGGGNRCSGGFDDTPCREIERWWRIEFGEDGGALPYGTVREVGALGRVYGWAADPEDPDAVVEVDVYLDGGADSGTLVTTVTADGTGPDGKTPGDHAFSFDLPEAERTGRERKLYAYAKVAGEQKPLVEEGYAFTAYTFSEAGRDFYENQVRGQLSGCQSCHAISYEQQFYTLIAPSPAEGGTATNNRLINNPAEANGETHGDGQKCGGVDSGVCADFQRWWEIEFGSQ